MGNFKGEMLKFDPWTNLVHCSSQVELGKSVPPTKTRSGLSNASPSLFREGEKSVTGFHGHISNEFQQNHRLKDLGKQVQSPFIKESHFCGWSRGLVCLVAKEAPGFRDGIPAHTKHGI